MDFCSYYHPFCVICGKLLNSYKYIPTFYNVICYVISIEDDSEQPTEGEEEKEAVTYQISNEVTIYINHPTFIII